MDQCLMGCLVSLSARFGAEGVGQLLVALHAIAQRHQYLDCELVNRELSASGLASLQVDEPSLGLALEALKRAGFVDVEPATVQ